MFVIKESGKLIRFADKQIRDNGGHRVGPFLWVKPVPTMPAGLARGLLLGRDKRRLVRQLWCRCLFRSRTDRLYAGPSRKHSIISIKRCAAARAILLFSPLATCRGRFVNCHTANELGGLEFCRLTLSRPRPAAARPRTDFRRRRTINAPDFTPAAQGRGHTSTALAGKRSTYRRVTRCRARQQAQCPR